MTFLLYDGVRLAAYESDSFCVVTMLMACTPDKAPRVARFSLTEVTPKLRSPVVLLTTRRDGANGLYRGRSTSHAVRFRSLNGLVTTRPWQRPSYPPDKYDGDAVLTVNFGPK